MASMRANSNDDLPSSTVRDDALPSLSDEWLAEIERHSAEYDAGAVQPIPWEQIRADALRAGLTVPNEVR